MHRFFVLLLVLLLYLPSFAQNEQTTDSIPKPISCSNWLWDAEHFNLKIEGAIVKKNEKNETGIELIAKEDLSNLSKLEPFFDDGFYTEKVLKVNNKRYSGTLYGYNAKTQAAFMAHFLDGLLHGNFVLQKSNGLIITKQYEFGSILQIIYGE